LNLIEEIKGMREEPKGVHFIEAGEVLVIGEQMVPNARLNKCDAFGMCEILRKTVSKPNKAFINNLNIRCTGP